ncbi:MAG: N-acetylmuramoyl-L-alanine amidase-like domain-containing protein [Vicinamibacteria bacterium]
MTTRSCLFATPLVLCLAGVADGADPSHLSPMARAMVQTWFGAVGAPHPGEEFGAYLARVAYLQHGVRYDEAASFPVDNGLRVELSRFECVTFIESSLAVARCGFEGTPTDSCFEKELIASRYRGGALGGYGSRLHYFDDWIYDNEARSRLRNLTSELGGEPLHRDFFHISSRVLPRSHLPPRELEELTREITASESRLSRRTHLVLPRERAPRALNALKDGDLVAFVRERPGLLVHHAGLIYRVGGRPKLLHASSYHHRVVLTSDDVTSYLLRRPERRGVLVARPLAP